MTPEETKRAWARRVFADKAWVLHTPTLAIGEVIAVFDGETTVYESPTTGEPVNDVVVVLSTKHSLIANPNAFIELAKHEMEFYVTANTKFAAFIRGAVEHAAGAAIPAQTTVRLILAMLQAQTRALETVTKGPQP